VPPLWPFPPEWLQNFPVYEGKEFLPGLLAEKLRWHKGRSHAFETCYRKRSLPDRPVYRDEGERMSIMARSR
jgi:hypothetical protein